jgi:hypothetical protein
MLTRSQIDRRLDQIKSWYWNHWPLCIFCGHEIRRKEGGQLAHLIRRSYSVELQTMKLNTGLAHHSCHEIFDNEPSQAIYLPRILECLYIIYLLDENYFYRIAGDYEPLAIALQLFPSVPYRDIKHHGELITLQYLIQ